MPLVIIDITSIYYQEVKAITSTSGIDSKITSLGFEPDILHAINIPCSSKLLEFIVVIFILRKIILYKDEKGTYVLRHSFTTESGKKIVSKNGKPFKIYINNNK